MIFEGDNQIGMLPPSVYPELRQSIENGESREAVQTSTNKNRLSFKQSIQTYLQASNSEESKGQEQQQEEKEEEEEEEEEMSEHNVMQNQSIRANNAILKQASPSVPLARSGSEQLVRQSQPYRRKQFQALNVKALETYEQFRPCEYVVSVLDSPAWNSLRNVYEQLSKGTQSRVKTKEFFRLANNLPKKILDKEATDIPMVDRTYTLRKLLFVLENKYPFSCKVSWAQIRQLVQFFGHLQEPSVDEILQYNPKEENSNFFSIGDHLLQELKQIFRQTTTFTFLFMRKSTQLAAAIHAHDLVSRYGEEKTVLKRLGVDTVTFRQAIDKFKRIAPPFVDLDEFLIYFSQKPCNINYHHFNKIDNKPEPRKFHCSPMHGHPEFGEQDKTTQSQSQSRSRANPTLKNNISYKQFVYKLEENKRASRQKRELEAYQHARNLEYLKENTKLFEPKKQIEPEFQVSKIIPKPVPKHIKQPLLEVIEQQKQSRKKKSLKEVISTYTQAWEALPQPVLELAKPKEHIQYQICPAPYYSPREVPDFKRLHRKFENQMAMRRENKRPTEVEQFNFNEVRGKYHATHGKVYEEEEGGNSCHFSHRSHHAQENEPQVIYYTQKYTDYVNFNEVRKQEALAKKRMEEKEERAREEKKAQFARQMRRELSRSSKGEKRDTPKKHQVLEGDNYQKELKRIYSNVIKRPYLFEMQTPKGHKEVKAAYPPLPRSPERQKL